MLLCCAKNNSCFKDIRLYNAFKKNDKYFQGHTYAQIHPRMLTNIHTHTCKLQEEAELQAYHAHMEAQKEEELEAARAQAKLCVRVCVCSGKADYLGIIAQALKTIDHRTTGLEHLTIWQRR
jgi:hypothetical protein